MGAIRPRSARSAARGDRWPQRPRNRTRLVLSGTFSFGPKQTRAPQQTSGRAFPVVSFVYLPVECPFYKFYRINCRPKLGAKLLDRFFHRRRQVSPVVNCLTHRFFDGDYHLFDGDVAVSFHDSLASHFGLPYAAAAGIVCGQPTNTLVERTFGGFRESSVPEWDRQFSLVGTPPRTEVWRMRSSSST